MENLDPIDEQLCQYLKSERIEAFSNTKYDLMLAKSSNWFEIKCRDDGTIIRYSDGQWSFPKKLVSKQLYTDFINESYELEKSDRDSLLEKLGKYPYYKECIPLENKEIGVKLLLERFDEGFSEYYLCFNTEHYKRIPLIKTNNLNLDNVNIIISNEENRNCLKLVLDTAYPHKSETTFLYQAIKSNGYNISIIFGIGIKLLFGEDIQEIYLEMNEEELFALGY